jgi:hypothetical protein
LPILVNALFGENAYFIDWKRSQIDWATEEMKHADGIVWMPWIGQIWLIEVEWKEGSNFFYQSRAFAKSKIKKNNLASTLKSTLTNYEKVLNHAAADMREGLLINNIINYTLRNHFAGDYFMPNIWVILGHGKSNYEKLKSDYLHELKARFIENKNYILSMTRFFQSNISTYILLEQICSEKCSDILSIKNSILVSGVANISEQLPTQVSKGYPEIPESFIMQTNYQEAEANKNIESSTYINQGRGAEFWSYLSEVYNISNPKNVKLRLQLDDKKYHDFSIDWEHSVSELMIFGKDGLHKKPSNAAKEVFGKDLPQHFGNISRKLGSFIDTSDTKTNIIASYSDIESSLRKIGKNKPKVEKLTITKAKGTGTYFDDINVHKQKQIIKNVQNRKPLWLEFIKRKKLTAEDFKKHSEFKPKAIAGFMHFLSHSGFAKRFGNVFTINESVIPHIEKLLKV